MTATEFNSIGIERGDKISIEYNKNYANYRCKAESTTVTAFVDRIFPDDIPGPSVRIRFCTLKGLPSSVTRILPCRHIYNIEKLPTEQA